VTERRADYSKFRPILKQIKKSSKLDYLLVVTGSHLLSSHGLTINEIKKDGFKISSKFQMYSKKSHDDGSEMSSALGVAITQLSKIIPKLNPDMILSGFDIGANLAAAIVGAHMNKVVGHIEGGEVTGTIDESIRHAITKFAHLHFVTNNQAANRVIKMGEKSNQVYTVGNTSLDSILNTPITSKIFLEKKFSVNLSKPLIIIIQHTVTSEIEFIDKHIQKTLDAVKELDLQTILIHGNADAGSKKIAKIIKNSKINQYTSLAFSDYVNLLKNASVLIGNSSSGIMEAPFLHLPSVNIGTRQNGRLRSPSIIDVNYNKNEIKKAILKAIYSKEFLKKINESKNLYGNGKSSEKIIKVLEKINLANISTQKKIQY